MGKVKSLQFPTIPPGLDKPLADFLRQLKDHLTSHSESIKKAVDTVTPAVKDAVPDASRMDEGQVLWVDDGSGDPAGYAKINGVVVRVGGGISNFNIDKSTLADGDYWGSALLNETVDSTVVAGDVIYLKSNGNYALAKADVYGTNPVSAMAITAGTGVMDILQWGIVNLESDPPAWAWTPGNLYLDYTTAGKMTQEDPNTWAVAGYQSQIVGIALSATIVKFFPMYPMAEVI